jgi:septal ring factor EnvC (AmiA/AmiB activator)
MYLSNLKNVTSISLLVIVSFAGAQNKLSSQRGELDQIRQEIESYKKEYQQKKKKESSTLNMIAALDREVDVASTLLRSLNKEIRRYTRQITVREKEITETEDELEKLRKKFTKRFVHFYKHGRANDLELLLSVKSFNKVRVWLAYAKRVADHDRRIYRSILEKKQSLERNRDLLHLEKSKKEPKTTPRSFKTTSEGQGISQTEISRTRTCSAANQSAYC